MVTVQVPDPDSAYSERALRAALATLAVRAKVPEEEELGLLPFAVGDLAGFHVDDVLRGRALMLRDAPAAPDAGKETDKETRKETDKETNVHGFDARMLIAAVPGGPSETDQRANFARLMFNEIGGIRQVSVTMSEPLRIGGQVGLPDHGGGARMRAREPMSVVIQWLRFGGGGYLQMVGIGSADSWTNVLARLRTVRDSVELK